MSKLNVNRVRDLLQEFEFQELFVEELGWNNPSQKQNQSVHVDDEVFNYKGVALLGGIEAFEVQSTTGLIPTRDLQLKISKEIAKVRLEHVLIFVDQYRTQSVWFWVKREDGKRIPREHLFSKGQPGDLFISKIAAMAVDLSELDDTGHLSLVDAAKKVQKALDIERVIRKFFNDYDEQRVQFTQHIKGISDEKDRRWYASVLLNRLMFIYFLQKKLFIDNGDANYLESRLTASKRRGKNQYYSEFLQALFFEAFAKQEENRTAETLSLTGRVKYLSGGLFLPHKLEQKYKIEVPDEAFEELFKLFGRYSWNLNDIPGESDDDINPDVLGYIFEKYINQKEFGAYYTRPEITEYLCEKTIHQVILDKTNGPDIEGFQSGRKFASAEELLLRLDMQTARKLLHDILPSLTILDPAVGSGAFLVAALKTLITVYAQVIGWLRFHDRDWLENHLINKWKIDPNREQYAIKKKIITDNLYGVDLMEEATEIAKLRLFMTLVASAKTVDDLEPLPNIDFNILAGNSLIGLMRVEDAEFEAAQRTKSTTASLFAPEKTYRQILDERNRKVETYRHASGYIEDLASLRQDVVNVEDEARPILGELLEQAFEELKVKVEEATWDEHKKRLGKPIKRPVTSVEIEAIEPFHWGFEFDEILNKRGGFDAIITNPPWEIFKPQDKEFFMRHSELVSKNRMTITEFDERKNEFLQNSEIKEAYLAYLSAFPHQSAYYRSAPEYSHQSATVNGKKTGTDVNLYKLFTERCYHLLRPQGLCGIVIPSGIYTDLGSTGLRRLLFENNTVTGLFCFENRKGLFEGVDSRFKFVVLNYRKGGTTHQFPAAFMRHDVLDLHRFPDSIGMNISMEFIRKLSAETLSVMEVKSQIELAIAAKMSVFPKFGDDIPGKWKIRLSNEIHMTNDKHLFLSEPGAGRLPLYEGKMMHQFEHQFAVGTRWIEEKRGRQAVLGRTIDDGQICDYQKYRLAHRAIARSTDERTMIATILPKHVFYGNSLYASRVPQRGDIELYTAALLNSLCIDYFLRLTVSANLNLNFIYQLPIPRLTATDVQFAPIVRRAARLICTTEEYADLWNEVDSEIGLNPIKENAQPGELKWTKSCGATDKSEREQIRAELDALVAQLYDLGEEEFKYVLSTFTSVTEKVKRQTLEEYRKLLELESHKSSNPLVQEVRAMLALPAENNEVEFKETLNWDVKQKNFNDERIMDVQKAICAFLNRSGGTILIGVQDDGNKPVGIANDLKKFGSLDRFQRKVTELFGTKLSPDPSELVSVRFVEIDGVTLARVEVRPDPLHAYELAGKVYVRRDGESKELVGTNLTTWWTRRSNGEE